MAGTKDSGGGSIGFGENVCRLGGVGNSSALFIKKN
jgi:hypothetical protein